MKVAICAAPQAALFDCDHGGQDENKQCTDQEADGPTIDEHVVLTGEGWGWRSCSGTQRIR